MEANFIKRYIDKPIPKLIEVAVRYCHRYIKKRDSGKGCISCGAMSPTDAGHFYSAGHYPALRFDERNIHLQCSKCNRFLHGNLNEYRKRLPLRVGEGIVDRLDLIVENARRKGFKWDRMALIEIIWRYKNKS